MAPSNRAGCKDALCKANGIKIMKGELRMASQVTIGEHTSWTYKHWFAALLPHRDPRKYSHFHQGLHHSESHQQREGGN